ncbi:hypothetical protein FHT80_006366 [Rhizobium sp. BK226]|uniref:hypothetical protein n=1 Tax=Rhizobium sp. BK226 TaxID=2587075 RepID=UPI001611841B|nr:hypothetical protein [Rhizobium sp. BK226]MBB4116985.1 hypothetical protein [Rhizobium sp. BK226]
MTKGFSATTVKSWFQYRCERKVRYELSSKSELAGIPITKDEREQSWAILGERFEDDVVARLGKDVLRPGRDEPVLPEVLSAAFLAGQRGEPYAAKLNLLPGRPPDFLRDTGLSLNRNITDLIRREGSSTTPGLSLLTVVDVKATRRATPFHKTQVAFYAKVLDEVLREMGLTDVRVSDHGEIWRIADKETAQSGLHQAEIFALSPYRRLVDDFCANVLPGIAAKTLTRDIDETFFHIYFKCEQCDFLDHCRDEISTARPPSARDVSAVAGLSHEAKRLLGRNSVSSVADLAKAEGLSRSAGLGWSLSRRANVLVARAKALETGAILRTEDEHTYLMPPRVDSVLLLSVDHDPVDDRIACLGYSRVEKGLPVRDPNIKVPRTGSLGHERDVLIEVLSELIADLTEIDAHNRAVAEGSLDDDPVYAHIFLYEPSEAINIQAAIGRHLDSEAIRSGLLHLVRLFPPDDVVPEPEFRGMHHLPATALRSVFEQLYALPVSVAYDLRQVSQAIAGTAPFAYRPEPPFERPFSSLLSIDVIRALRESPGKSPGIAAIQADARSRLNAMTGLIGWLFERNREATVAGSALLRLAKRPFLFQTTFNPLDAVDLDLLLACEILENRSGLLEALVGLARPFRRRRDAGRCYANLRLDRDFQGPFQSKRMIFRIPKESRAADLSSSDMDLILHDDSPDLRLNPALWGQIGCRIVQPGFELDDDEVCIEISSQVIRSQEYRALRDRVSENGWFIDKAFFDVNSQRAAAFISYLGS